MHKLRNRNRALPDAPDRPVGGSDGGSRPPTPRWVKVGGFLVLAALVALAFMLVAGGGQHGPGRHGGNAQQLPAGQTPGNPDEARLPSSGGGHTPPAGGHTPPAGGE